MTIRPTWPLPHFKRGTHWLYTTETAGNLHIETTPTEFWNLESKGKHIPYLHVTWIGFTMTPRPMQSNRACVEDVIPAIVQQSSGLRNGTLNHPGDMRVWPVVGNAHKCSTKVLTNTMVMEWTVSWCFISPAVLQKVPANTKSCFFNKCKDSNQFCSAWSTRGPSTSAPTSR